MRWDDVDDGGAAARRRRAAASEEQLKINFLPVPLLLLSAAAFIILKGEVYYCRHYNYFNLSKIMTFLMKYFNWNGDLEDFIAFSLPHCLIVHLSVALCSVGWVGLTVNVCLCSCVSSSRAEILIKFCWCMTINFVTRMERHEILVQVGDVLCLHFIARSNGRLFKGERQRERQGLKESDVTWWTSFNLI